MPTWIILITWITRAVLLLLVVLSIWSVAIMIDRWKYFKKEDESVTDEAMDFIRRGDRLGLQAWSQKQAGYKARTVHALIEAPDEPAEKSVRRVASAWALARPDFEKGLTVLGSLGSNAPFIGLFGTVLGVIQAFGALSFQQGNMSLVMLAIAEALIATAVGLFVAIPAVIAYNYFLKRLKKVTAEAEAIRDLFLAQFPSRPPLPFKAQAHEARDP